jgi:hypothetical protein
MCIVILCSLVGGCPEDGTSIFETSQMLVAACKTTQCQNSESHSLNSHCFKILRSHFCGFCHSQVPFVFDYIIFSSSISICQTRNAFSILVRKPEGKRSLGGWCKDRQKLLKWIINRLWICGLDLSNSEQEPVVGCYEHANEPTFSIISCLGEWLFTQKGLCSKELVS